MSSPTHVTMNTSATYTHLCAYEDRRCNRLCTAEALPDVVSTGPDLVIVPGWLLCLEKGGDTIDELSSAMKEFLRVQSTVKKLQGNIKKLSKQLESQE
jgi:hypothetical protein